FRVRVRVWRCTLRSSSNRAQRSACACMIWSMASSQWSVGRVLARWKLALVPVGFSMIVYGNSLYGGPNQRLGWVLFLAGWVITVSGMPAWKRFVDEDPLRAGYERYVWVVFFLILFL